ncbi:Transmembrane and coiled-coil domain-containing protein 3 [Lamellibrachia satsuma]|nr:Transmembrane and coiled-coil domain-containing protein 3 [Lamellibrachia satsuma]
MGILVMQDVYLGVIMAILPNITGQRVAGASQHMSTVYVFLTIRLVITLAAVLLLCYLLGKYLIGRFFRHIVRLGSTELTVLATIVIMFSMVILTSRLGVSMELGCFLAGVIISAQGHKLAERVEQLLEPLQHFLSCFFFTSIGLHVFPQFLAYELTILMTFTMATVALKYVISVGVLALVIHKSPWQIKWIVSAGLAQVSEFAFVLGSRARRLELVSREVYLLILGVTTLSLVFAPVLWKATLWYLRLKPAQDSSVTSHGVTYDSETDDLMADIRQSTQAIGHSTQVTARSTQVTGRSIQGGDYSAYDLGLGGRSQVL